MTITFDYAPWDDKKDVLPTGAGNQVAISAIRYGLEIGRWPSVKQERQSDLGGLTILGVAELLAAAIEYFRHRGVPNTEVSQLVRAYLAKVKGSTRAEALKDVALKDAVEKISDPRGWERLLDKENIIG